QASKDRVQGARLFKASHTGILGRMSRLQIVHGAGFRDFARPLHEILHDSARLRNVRLGQNSLQDKKTLFGILFLLLAMGHFAPLSAEINRKREAAYSRSLSSHPPARERYP